MDRDPLGLEDEQEYHRAILAWLREREVVPVLQLCPEEVVLLAPGPDGVYCDVTDEFGDRFEGEFDCWQVDSRGEVIDEETRETTVSAHPTDFNHHTGGMVVSWADGRWELSYRDG